MHPKNLFKIQTRPLIESSFFVFVCLSFAQEIFKGWGVKGVQQQKYQESGEGQG